MIPLRCACGAVHGALLDPAPSTVVRLRCHCGSCKDYVHRLGRDDVIDGEGGVPVVQVAPGRVRLDAGQEHVVCGNLAPGGLMRWYAGCCRTPLGNTARSAAVPFVGLHEVCLQVDDAALDGVLGPVRARVNLPPGTVVGGPIPSSRRAGLTTLARAGRQMLGWRLHGHHRPHPFFDDAGAPIAPPTVMPPRG